MVSAINAFTQHRRVTITGLIRMHSTSCSMARSRRFTPSGTSFQPNRCRGMSVRQGISCISFPTNRHPRIAATPCLRTIWPSGQQPPGATDPLHLLSASAASTSLPGWWRNGSGASGWRRKYDQRWLGESIQLRLVEYLADFGLDAGNGRYHDGDDRGGPSLGVKAKVALAAQP